MGVLYTIRNYRAPDFDAYLTLLSQSERFTPSGRNLSPVYVLESLYRPGHDPDTDLFLAESGAKLAGYLDLASEAAIGRVVLDCFVLPGFRRRGLGRRLVEAALTRARSLGAKAAQFCLSGDNETGKTAAYRLGFHPVRRFFNMALDLESLDPLTLGGEARVCRLRRGEEDRLTDLQNRAFAGSWGFQPNSVLEVIYRTNLRESSAEDVVLVCEGDTPVAYAWTGVGGRTGENLKKGQILMLGVDPARRSRGLGRRALVAGLALLRRRGVGVVELTVDADNVPALKLYLAAGFRVSSASVWYEREVSAAVGDAVFSIRD